jgi:hypothetical protein
MPFGLQKRWEQHFEQVAAPMLFRLPVPAARGKGRWFKIPRIIIPSGENPSINSSLLLENAWQHHEY